MSVVNNIAVAVKAEIEGATLSQTPTVRRVYVPMYDRTKVTGLQIYVLGLGQDISQATRGGHEFIYQIPVAIYKPIDADSSGDVDVTQVDAMVDFTEEVVDLLRSKYTLTSYAAAHLTDVANTPVYDERLLREFSIFVSVINVKYKLQRAVS